MASTDTRPGDRRSDAAGDPMALLAAAAHELRTPLTSIAGFASTLLAHHEEMTPAGIHDALVILERQTQRLAATVDQVLDLTAHDRGGAPHSPVELADVVADAIETAPPPAGVTVTVEGAPDDAPLLVSSERLAMTRALINLLTNAYNYGGPHVTVASHNGKGDVTLTVEDDGPGIAESLLPTLFAPFVRGGNGADAHPPGAGLGLALARTIVESCDGHLRYEATHPHGARFVLTLPVVPPAPRGRE